MYVCVTTAYVHQLTSISEKLSIVAKTDPSEQTPLSTELFVIDVNNLSAETCDVKVNVFVCICVVRVCY